MEIFAFYVSAMIQIKLAKRLTALDIKIFLVFLASDSAVAQQGTRYLNGCNDLFLMRAMR